MRISDWSSDVCSSDLWNHADEGEAGTTVVYAGTMESSRRLDKLPGDIDALLDEAGLSDAVGQDEVPESDWDILDTIRGNREFLAWAYDLGHGTIELSIRKRRTDSPVYLAAWGPWELARNHVDAKRVRSGKHVTVIVDMGGHGILKTKK